MPDQDDTPQFNLILEDPKPSSSAPVRIGRDEMNLAEFPFALLSDRAPKDLHTVRFEDTVEGKDGKLVTRAWTLTAGESFGLPIAADEEVYVALMEVTKEQGFDERTVNITRYDLIKRLGWADKGDSYRRLHAALDRLLSVTIKADKAFWDKEKQRYVDVGFHIIDDYALYDETPGRKRKGAQEPLPLSFISWNQVIFRSFQAGNIKQLDTAFFFALRSSISRRLYRYLDKKRYDGKGTFRIGLKKLAFEKLGMSRNYYPSHIKQELKRAHDELIEYGFLAGVDYQKPKGKAEELVVYRFTRRKFMVRRELAEDSASAELVEQLGEAGVSRGPARNLVKQFGDEVRVQLQYQAYRSADDPAAVLVEAIRGSWEPPASYLKARADEQRRVAEEKTRSLQEKAKAEEDARAELERAVPKAVFDSLNSEQQQELSEQAAERIAAHSPAVAERPSSRAYKAMHREQIDQAITGSYLEECEKVRKRLRKEARLDLNDDL